MAYLPQELQWLGAGKETTFGTKVGSTHYIPVTDIKPADVPTMVSDAGMRGVMAGTFAKYQSVINSTFEADGAVYPDSFGLFLLSMLGIDTVAGTSNKTHTFTMAPVAQPASLTLNYFDGFNERAFAGSKCSELDIKWAKNAALAYVAKFSGLGSEVITTETPAVSTAQQLMAWNFALQLNSVANLNLESFELDLKRKADIVWAANNSQQPSSISLGGLTATGKATFAIQDDTELALALNNTQEPLIFTGIQSGTNYGLTIQMSQVAFTEPTIAGKSHMQLNVNFEGIYNATDAGPVQISLINNVASY
jgi:hypothetical protein